MRTLTVRHYNSWRGTKKAIDSFLKAVAYWLTRLEKPLGTQQNLDSHIAAACKIM